MSDLNETGPFLPRSGNESATATPPYIGRYRVERILGEGGFGVVYLAHDDQLQRLVAIKVPHAHLIAQTSNAEAYLTEARTVANLEHPNIVPVHDLGSTDQFPCFIVSKFIEGSTLAYKIKKDRPSVVETVEVIATVAQTLHYAHGKGVVHRDIKPSNILLDKSGKPFVADFGLALREQEFGRGARYVGTPAYMSPEQARGEGHRVDGRSDLFSLGVVFYELLTGRRPFQAETREELLERISQVEARPPRQFDDRIPKELERICLKALSKRSTERYTTAKDMSDDLRHFLAAASAEEKSAITGQEQHEEEVGTPLPSPAPTPSDQHVVRIVPKGLRSFDAADADFFLELLPGPRDRDGLPDSLRFWKSRIEATDADNTFAVGLIYGPSGCGKSSLVKAGLLPILAQSVNAVYIEAIGAETEARLLKVLRRQVADLPQNMGLIESLAALRQGQYLKADQKVLLILDQFEQWLHAKRSEEDTELVQALRQCDGGRLQGIVMVRDDFWLAVSRFMQALEVRVLEGENSRLVDLFDLRHAKKVLTAFGQAFGALPERELAKEQDTFLDQAVAGLAEDGKVISVRLALFAEMVKGKSWTPATLDEVGGIEGIGVTFLEETFTASTAPPQHRLHQKAAQATLKALLPETGIYIKGHMRSEEELLAASGYSSRPRDFDDLLRILDGELRLITPTDPEGRESQSASRDAQRSADGARYYQLTHDYLVPSLRNWLTRKQKETRRGRAELLLADRAAVWNARPENRQLPSLLQWSQIGWLTAKKNWTPPQRKMMGKAARVHGLRAGMLAILVALIGWGAYEGHGTLKAHALRDRLIDANINEVPAIVKEMAPYRSWLDSLLHDAQAEKDGDTLKQLRLSLALLPGDTTQVEYLYGRLLDAEPLEVVVIRDALTRHKDGLVDRLWAVVAKAEIGKEKARLRGACALATYDAPDNAQGIARWQSVSKIVTDELLAAVQKNPSHYATLVDQLRPVRARLLPPLSEIYRSKDRADSERSFAASILADFAADDPHMLAELLMDADEKQFAVIYPKLKEYGEKSALLLTVEIVKKPPPDLPSSDKQRETLAKRQANAAVALLRMNGAEKVWPLLRRVDQPEDPRLRSYLIHRLAPLGADAAVIGKRLDEEADVTIRRALVLSLGEYSANELSADSRKSLVPKLQALYLSEADPGLHAAVEWLLRQWKEEPWLGKVNDKWAKDKEQRDKRLASIQQSLGREKEKAPPQWYVNGQGQTMVVIPGPAEFLMGSPATEEGRFPIETQHPRRIGRTFAVAAKSVTVNEFRRFLKANKLEAWFAEGGKAAPMMKRYSPEESGPIILVDWFHAALYCNWLSEQEGIPAEQWCYETSTQRLLQEKANAAMVMLLQRQPLAAAGTSSYFLLDHEPQVTGLRTNCLSLAGYRLPTEAEMEYATRAGALTSRYFGETEELLPKYAWYVKNAQERTWPVGRLKPNEFGLFDAQGNVYTWCQERHMDYPQNLEKKVIDDGEDTLSINAQNTRALRGGSFSGRAASVRSSSRFHLGPANRFNTIGFRPARTYR